MHLTYFNGGQLQHDSLKNSVNMALELWRSTQPKAIKDLAANPHMMKLKQHLPPVLSSSSSASCSNPITNTGEGDSAGATWKSAGFLPQNTSLILMESHRRLLQFNLTEMSQLIFLFLLFEITKMHSLDFKRTLWPSIQRRMLSQPGSETTSTQTWFWFVI